MARMLPEPSAQGQAASSMKCLLAERVLAPRMKRIALLALLLASLSPLGAQTPKAPKKRAPNPAFAPVQDVAGLPRVLLIGDSISIGYTLDVRELLKGKANVHRIPTNGGPTTNGLANLSKWLGDSK